MFHAVQTRRGIARQRFNFVRIRQSAISAVFFLVACQALLAQQPGGADRPSSYQEAPQTPRRAERLAAMQKIAAEIVVDAVDEGGKHEVELVEGARFRFSSQVTRCYDATVWIWGRRGRPAALLTLSAERSGRQSPSYWAFELTSISPQALAVASRDGWNWTPQAAGLSFLAIPDAEPPSDDQRIRLRQMKDLARRFDAHGVGGSGRYELRVMPTPIHRYSDAPAGVIDGALFFIAGDTDPEVLLAIEGAARDDGSPHWTYAINRVSSAELHAGIDGKEIWTSPHVVNATIRSPYYLFHQPMQSELGDE